MKMEQVYLHKPSKLNSPEPNAAPPLPADGSLLIGLLKLLPEVKKDACVILNDCWVISGVSFCF